MTKFFLNFIILLSFVHIVYCQKQLNGPFGADVTYFFKSKTEYWIGTGSSGGIFHSKSLSSSWVPCNNPFGPAHIYWINEINDTLFTKADSLFFYLNKKNFTWNKISDSSNIERMKIEEELSHKADFLKFSKHGINKLPFSSCDLNSIFFFNNDSILLCTSLGLFTFDNYKKRLKFIELKGIVATDIYQIQMINNNQIICLSQDKNIWLYNLKNSKWDLLFDFKSTNYFNYKNNNISSVLNKNTNIFNRNFNASFYPKGRFNLYKDSLVVYVLSDIIFLINLKTKRIKSIYGPKNHELSEAEFVTNNGILAIGDFRMNSFSKWEYSSFNYLKDWKKISNLIPDSFFYMNNNIFDLNGILERYKYFKNNLKYSYTSFMYPSDIPLLNTGKRILLLEKLHLSNYSGFYFANKINTKINSGLLNMNTGDIYFGTYGSGLILLEDYQ